MAAAAAVEPPGYFVGAPLHLQGRQPQEAVTTTTTPAAAVDQQSAVKALVPGYYNGPVQGKRGPAEAEHNNSAGTVVQQSQEQGFLARWFGCFSGRSGNLN